MRLALMQPLSIRLEWQFPIKRRLETQFASHLCAVETHSRQKPIMSIGSLVPTGEKKKKNFIWYLICTALNMIEGLSFWVSPKIKPRQSPTVMGIQVFSQKDNHESHSGLNFQSQSQLPKVCVNPTAHSHSFIIATGRRRLGYCEQPICLFSAQAHISRAGGGAKLNRETRAGVCFPTGLIQPLA